MSITKWVIDPTHSEIGFKIKHMFTNVHGRFKTFEGSAEFDENGENLSNINFTAEVSSIKTGNSDRDGHLQGPDFFDIEKNPQISFQGHQFVKSEDTQSNNYQIYGSLTMHGITNPLVLSATFNGVMNDPWSNRKAGFSILGEMNRKDWGLTWNSVLDTGNLLVGEAIELNIEVQLVKQS
jgi:polyisoprenoid-binding protein YceI